jgi:hypothetical protein
MVEIVTVMRSVITADISTEHASISTNRMINWLYHTLHISWLYTNECFSP